MSRLLRLESLVLLAICLYAYHLFEGSWIMFGTLLFAFDISMLGYLKNNTLGAAIYNLGHSYTLPGLLVLTGYANGSRMAVLVALIWLAHISLDRTLGYGLKLHDFHHTHLGKIGNSRTKQPY
jgi:hypothetical protein